MFMIIFLKLFICMPTFITNSANTLSLNFSPGEDFRDFPTQGDSIFSFGDYRMYRNSSEDQITGTTYNLSFDGFESLNTMNLSGFSQKPNYFVSAKELNLSKNKATSYHYFSSFKLDAVIAMEKIIKNFPYAVASIGNSTSAITAYDYTGNTDNNYSEFKISTTTIVNQGDIILNSGSTNQNTSLLTDVNDFVVQLSGVTNYTNEKHKILEYSFSAGNYIYFKIEGILLSGQTSGDTILPIWIRPTEKKLKSYYNNLTPLEDNLLNIGKIKVVNPYYDDGNYIEKNILWSKNIDGFNPDISGSYFETYKNNVLNLSDQIDDDTTNIMIRTMIPENYIDYDSDNNIYRKIVQTYANQFDQIKRYIDAIAFGHTITYNGEESVPDKFLLKLSELLGWKLKSGFDEIDLFDYLANGTGEASVSKKGYDLQTWRRILVNINWLFKRKGTRDALMFIFRLIGAPDCLIRFDEFVYNINQTFNSGNTTSNSILSPKINENGFVNYEASQHVFQQGGRGRGTGQNYINQWMPEFNPIKTVDNKKVYSGNSDVFGSENVINTKELNIGLEPSKAIECDMFSYYKLSGTCWVWGSENPYSFDVLTVPFEYAIEDCDLVNPPSITGMTLSQWVDFIYTSNVDPRGRKVSNAQNGGYHYQELRKIYIHYYLNQVTPSNQLTFSKLEGFLQTIEMNFFNSMNQLIPATTILNGAGTIYKNTVFNRQKFVYKRGLNDGSEFRNEVTTPPEMSLTPVVINGDADNVEETYLTPINLGIQVSETANPTATPYELGITVSSELVSNVGIYNIQVTVDDSEITYENYN